MPYSSGTFSRVHDFTDDRDNGIRIQASRMDAEMDGIATGLSTALLKDGTQTATAKIPFAVGLSVIDNQTILLGTNSDIAIQYDETTNDSLEISANVEGAALGIVLKSDQGDDNADQHKLSIADGGTLTLGSKISGSFVTYLTHTPNATVTSSTLAVAGNLTVGGNLTLGSGAELSEAELEMLDGITAGTVAASKAVVVDANKDIASFRNITLTGELDAGSLDVSGDVDIDGTLETDALSIASTAITATGAELNLNDTGAAVGTVVASKTVTVDANKDVSSFRNITLTGELDAGSLDVSGDADIDGTTNLDVVDIDSTLNVQGETTLQTHLNMGDNDTIKLGDSADLQLFHDGSNSYITEGGTGDLRIRATNLVFQATDETALAEFNDGGAVNLRYSGNLKLQTKSDGVDIVGELQADSLDIDGAADITGQVNFHSNVVLDDGDKIILGNGSDLQIYHDGSNSYISDQGTGNLKLLVDDFRVNTSGDTQVMIAANTGAQVYLYYDGAIKLATTSTGIQVTGNIANASGDMTLDVGGDLTLDADGGEIYLKNGGTHWGTLLTNGTPQNFYIDSKISDGDIIFRGNDGGSTITALTLNMSDAGTAIFNHDVSLADNGKANFGSSADFQIYHDSSNAYLRNELSDSDIIFQVNDGGSQVEVGRFDASSRGMAVGTYNGVGLHTMVVGGATGGNATFKAGNTSTSGNTTCILAFMDGSGSASVNSAFLQGFNGSNNFYLLGNGTHTFTSDENAKKNIETTRDGYLEDLAKLRVVKYNWKEQDDSEDKELGLIAQEVETVFPKLVMLDIDPQIEDADKKKMIKTTVLPFMLLKGLQEANTKIEALKTENATQSTQIADLISRITALENA